MVSFCKTFVIRCIKTLPYHPRSNEQAECFVDTMKRALKKTKGAETMAMLLQQLLHEYQVKINLNTIINKEN